MKFSVRLLATAAGSTRSLKPAPLALLPPIPLYRRILRTHRKHLDPEMRILGDQYVKSEFRAHRAVENPVHIVGASASLYILTSLASTLMIAGCECLSPI